jgi:hypothetical protein
MGYKARQGMAERWNGRTVKILACLIVALELWAAVTHVVHISRQGLSVAKTSSYPVQEADLDPFALYATPEALVRARAVIPPNATYSVVLGRGLTAMEREAPSAFKLALLPRVYTSDRHRAQWVIAYMTGSDDLGVRFDREIGLGPNVNLVHVAS